MGWKMQFHYDNPHLLEYGSNMKIFCLLSEALGCERKWDLQPGSESALTLLFVLSRPGTVQQVPPPCFRALLVFNTVLSSVSSSQHGSPIMCPGKLFLCLTSGSSWYLMQQKKNMPFPTLKQNTYLHLLFLAISIHCSSGWVHISLGIRPHSRKRICVGCTGVTAALQGLVGLHQLQFQFKHGHLCDKFSSILCGINTSREEKYVGWKGNRG